MLYACSTRFQQRPATTLDVHCFRQVKSTLDPCEDDNNTMKEDNGPFLGCQDSETSVSEGDQHSDANTVPVPTSAPNIKVSVTV